MAAWTDLRALLAALALVACEKPERPISVDARALPGVTTVSTTPTTSTATAATTRPDPPRSLDAGAAPDRLRFVAAAADLDVLSLVRSERLKAKAAGRVLVVYVGASWCPPCREFHRMSRAGAYDARAPRITLLEFDADEDEARLKAAGYTFRYVPFFVLPSADGAPGDTLQIKGKAGEATQQEIARKLESWQGP